MSCTISARTTKGKYTVSLQGVAKCIGTHGWMRIYIRYSDGHVLVFPPAREEKCLREAGHAYPVVGELPFKFSFVTLPGFPHPVVAEIVIVNDEGKPMARRTLQFPVNTYLKYPENRPVYVITPKRTIIVRHAAQHPEKVYHVIRTARTSTSRSHAGTARPPEHTPSQTGTARTRLEQRLFKNPLALAV